MRVFMKVVGLFSRSGPDQPWNRIKREAERRDMLAFQQIYPNRELALFEYEDVLTTFTALTTKHMKRVS